METLLIGHVSDVPAFIEKLKSLSYQTALFLDKSFPKIRELGLGISGSYQRPAIYGFKILKDKSIYYRKEISLHEEED